MNEFGPNKGDKIKDRVLDKWDDFNYHVKSLSRFQKRLIALLIVTIITVGVIALIFFFIPWDGKTILNRWIAEANTFKEGQGERVFSILTKLLPWIFIVWNITQMIRKEIMLHHRKKQYILKTNDAKPVVIDAHNKEDFMKRINRTQQRNEQVFNEIVALLKSKGFDLKGAVPFSLKEIINNTTLMPETKKNGIRDLLDSAGIPVDYFKELKHILKLL